MNGRRSFAAMALPVTLSACGAFARPQLAPPDAHAALAAPIVSPGTLNARALLGDEPSRASRLGAGPPSLVASGQMLDNEWIGGFVDLPRDACLLAYARAAPSIEDIDVSVYSDEGTSLTADEGRDVHPTVLLCPPHPDRVYVAAHVVEGEGLVAVGAQLVPRERATIVARALGARDTVWQGPRPADAWPGLEDAVRAHRRELGGKWEEFRRVALPVDARVPTFASMTIEADHCVDALVLSDDDVSLLDVEAVDGDGRVVARAGSGPGPRTLTVCSPTATAGTLALRPHTGRGLSAVVLARASADVTKDLAIRPQIAWVTTAIPLDVARTNRNARLAKQGYRPPVATTAGTLTLGRRVSLPIDLRSLDAPCARIDVIAGAPLSLMQASVWSDSGALFGSGEASSSMALFVCSRSVVRLELETQGRPGPFAVTVRPERWRDASFSTHPLAASRMITRAADGPEMLLEGKESAVRDLILDASQTLTFGEKVPAGKCLRVVIGTEGEGAGVEVRAFDGPDNEIDRAEAAHATAVRACAPADESKDVRFEVRASAGRLAAVLGERLVDDAVPNR